MQYKGPEDNTLSACGRKAGDKERNSSNAAHAETAGKQLSGVETPEGDVAYEETIQLAHRSAAGMPDRLGEYELLEEIARGGTRRNRLSSKVCRSGLE
jgi:hypothetical protein